jgi:hypothetical protein
MFKMINSVFTTIKNKKKMYFFFLAMLGMEPRSLSVLGKHLPLNYISSPQCIFFTPEIY